MAKKETGKKVPYTDMERNSINNAFMELNHRIDVMNSILVAILYSNKTILSDKKVEEFIKLDKDQLVNFMAEVNNPKVVKLHEHITAKSKELEEDVKNEMKQAQDEKEA